MKRKVLYVVTAYTRAGLSPTEKQGNVSGNVFAGFTFEDVGVIRGWVGIASNKWIPLSATEVYSEPPPVDPPITSAYPERFMVRYPDGAGGWLPWQEYVKVSE